MGLIVLPWGVIFFAVNLAASLGWLTLTGISFARDSDWGFFTFLIAATMAAPAIALAVAEWLLFGRQIAWLERPLGIIAGLVGALALFALVANAGEAVAGGRSPGSFFWIGFGSICLGVATYAFWCCWLRVRRRTIAARPGFPV
jgi:hypothetical protein